MGGKVLEDTLRIEEEGWGRDIVREKGGGWWVEVWSKPASVSQTTSSDHGYFFTLLLSGGVDPYNMLLIGMYLMMMMMPFCLLCLCIFILSHTTHSLIIYTDTHHNNHSKKQLLLLFFFVLHNNPLVSPPRHNPRWQPSHAPHASSTQQRSKPPRYGRRYVYIYIRTQCMRNLCARGRET